MFRIFLESAHLSALSKSFTVVYDASSIFNFKGSNVSISWFISLSNIYNLSRFVKTPNTYLQETFVYP